MAKGVDSEIATAANAQVESAITEGSWKTNDANDTSSQFSKQESNQNSTYESSPSSSSLGKMALAIGMAGIGWHYLRKLAMESEGNTPSGA